MYIFTEWRLWTSVSKGIKLQGKFKGIAKIKTREKLWRKLAAFGNQSKIPCWNGRMQCERCMLVADNKPGGLRDWRENLPVYYNDLVW